MEKDPDKWILHLEGLQTCMNELGLKGNITDKDSMIHALNNLPKDNDVILDGLGNNLMMTRDDVLTINVICKKLNHWNEKFKSKKRRKNQKRKVLRSL